MKIKFALAFLASGLLLAACEKEGPLERAGEEADEAVENLRNRGETIGNRIDDAVDDVRNRVEEAADEAEEAVDELRR